MQADQLLEGHASILKMFSDLDDALKADRLQDVVALRWKMNRILLGHLSLEDQIVYPVLASCPDRETAALARRMMNEMGGIAAQWRDYITRWTLEQIRSHPVEFRQQTTAIHVALAKRIEREERDLFPKLETPGCTASRSISCTSSTRCIRA